MNPLYARPLTEDERQVLRQSLKSANGFTVRRAQLLLKSANEGLKVETTAQQVRCQGQAVRQAIHAFHHAELTCLQPQAKGNPTDREHLGELMRRSPHELGYEIIHPVGTGVVGAGLLLVRANRQAVGR